MIIQPRQFVQFVDGRAGDHAPVAFLPGGLGAYLNTLRTEVILRRDYAIKVLNHLKIYEIFGEIQNTIDRGFCVQMDPVRLGFLYVRDAVRPEIYFLLIKTARQGEELWLVTFHRIQPAQFDVRLRGGRLLREHDGEFSG
jgi:hypothetical protein